MRRLATAATLSCALLVFARPAAAQELACANYAPDQSGVARTILRDDFLPFILVSEGLALIGPNLVDLRDPENPVQLPTWGNDRDWVAATTDSTGYWLLRNTSDGFVDEATVFEYLEREEIGHATGEALISLRGYSYAHAFGDGMAYVATAEWNQGNRENIYRFYSVDIRSQTPFGSDVVKSDVSEFEYVSSVDWSNHIVWKTSGVQLSGSPSRGAAPGQGPYSMNFGAACYSVISDAERVFVAHPNGQISALAITGPTSLEVRKSIRVPGLVDDMWLYGDLLYVAMSLRGFLVLDVSRIEDPQVRDFWPRYASPEQALVHGDYLYLLDRRIGVEQIPLDARSLEPVPLLALYSPSSSRSGVDLLQPLDRLDAMAIGNSSYVNLERVVGFGVRQSLGLISMPVDVEALATFEDVLFAGGWHGIHAVEVGPEGSLTRRGSAEYASTITALARYERALYGLDPTLGVVVFDLADPHEPRLGSAVDLQHSGLRALVLHGDRLLVLADDALFTFDLHDPLNPRLAFTFPLASGHKRVAVTTRGDLALSRAADPHVTLHRFDGASAPQHVGDIVLESAVTALHAVDDLLYVGTESSGLRAFDVSHPGFPTDLGHMGIPGSPSAIGTVGNVVVAMSGSTGSGTHTTFGPSVCTDFRVPALVRDFEVQALSSELLVRAEVEGAVQAGDLRVEIRVMDSVVTTHPMFPTRLRGIQEVVVPRPTAPATIELQVREGDRWIALAQRSVEPAIAAAHFHLACEQSTDGSGFAMVQFGSPERIVDVSVFDLRGRRVVRLGAGMPQGEGTLSWDRRGIARGTYFLRMQTETREISRKVVVATP